VNALKHRFGRVSAEMTYLAALIASGTDCTDDSHKLVDVLRAEWGLNIVHTRCTS